MPNAPSVVLKNFSSASICFVTPFFITPVNVKDSASDARSSCATTSKRFPPPEEIFSRLPPWNVASSPVGVAIAGSARYTRVHSCVCKSYENASLIGVAPDMPPKSISDSLPVDASMAKVRASGSTAPFRGIDSAVTVAPSARRTKKSSRSTSSSSSLRCTPPKTYTASPAAHIAAPFRGLNSSPSTVCSTQASDPPFRSSVTKSSMETSSDSPPKMTNLVGVSMVIAGPWRLAGGPRGAASSSSGSGSGSGSGSASGSASGTIGLPSSSSSGSGGGTGLPSSSSSGSAGSAGSAPSLASSAGGSSSAGGGVSGAAGGSSASAGAASSGLASAASPSPPSAAAFSAAAASAAASSAASFSSRISWWRDFIAR